MFTFLWKIFTYGERPPGSLPEAAVHDSLAESGDPAPVLCAAANAGVPLPPDWEVVALIAPSALVAKFRAEIAAHVAQTEADLRAAKAQRSGHSEFMAGSVFSGPSMNVDGTPMVGMLDVNGNPYGVTSMR